MKKIGEFFVFKRSDSSIGVVENKPKSDIEKIGKGYGGQPAGRMAVYEEDGELRIEDLGGEETVRDLLNSGDSEIEVDPEEL